MENEILVRSLREELGLSIPDVISAEQIHQALAAWVSELLNRDAHHFYQLMYRLDIPEGRLHAVLKDKANGVDKLAHLVYERQLRKAQSRQEHKPPTPPADDELGW